MADTDVFTSWPAFGPASEQEAWAEYNRRGRHGPKPVALDRGLGWIIPPWPPEGFPLPRPPTAEEMERSRAWIEQCMLRPVETPGSAAKRQQLTRRDRIRIAAVAKRRAERRRQKEATA